MRLSFEVLRKKLWLVPAAAGLILLLRWIPTYGRPAHLFDVRGEIAAVRDGMMVVLGRRRGTLTVRPTRADRVRLGPISLPREMELIGTQVTATALVFLTRKQTPSPGTSASPLQLGQIIGYDYELHRMALDGSKTDVRRFRTSSPVSSALLTSEGCYWWGDERSNSGPLCFMPLDGGEVRVIRRGKSEPLLSGPQGGVLCRGRLERSRPQSGRLGSDRGKWQAVWFSSNGEVLGQYDDVPMAFQPVVAGERLYWIEEDVQPLDPTSPNPDRVVSSRLDGSDRRGFLQAQDRSVNFAGLQFHDESLYWTLTEPAAERSHSVLPRYRTMLCRVPPGNPEGLERVCVFPGPNGGNCYLDGSDAFIAAQEQRENWLDWSPRGLIPRRVTAWYHYRLPAE